MTGHKVAARDEPRLQPLVHHFMFGPGFTAGCPACSGTDRAALGRDEGRGDGGPLNFPRRHDEYGPT